jgi:hypothetical protein
MARFHLETRDGGAYAVGLGAACLGYVAFQLKERHLGTYAALELAAAFGFAYVAWSQDATAPLVIVFALLAAVYVGVRAFTNFKSDFDARRKRAQAEADRKDALLRSPKSDWRMS